MKIITTAIVLLVLSAPHAHASVPDTIPSDTIPADTELVTTTEVPTTTTAPTTVAVSPTSVVTNNPLHITVPMTSDTAAVVVNGELPRTGDGNAIATIVMGFLILALGIAALVTVGRRRPQQLTDEELRRVLTEEERNEK